MTEVNIGSICLQAKIRTFTYGHVGNPEPAGDVVFLWVQKPTPLKEAATTPAGRCRTAVGAKTNTAQRNSDQ
ncbi:hypothetical protein ACU4GH_31665 [Bradyrhizobium betae]